MTNLLWIGTAFLLGSIPFSVWLGQLALKTDIRRYGDSNPGATNAWRAGGWWVGIPALILDVSKGAVPVGLANFVAGISGWELILIALAPILGHAFSPFLQFRGGKALAVSLGIWIGLLGVEGLLVLAILMTVTLIVINNNDWAAVLGSLSFGAYLLLMQADFVALAVWAGNMLILLWKYRHNLQHKPGLCGWLVRRLRGNNG